MRLSRADWANLGVAVASAAAFGCSIELACAQDGDGGSVAADRGTMVLVYDPSLKDAAIEWAAFRAEGRWRVIMQPVEESADQTAKDIREQIRAHWRLAQPESPAAFMVLLLGDVSDASSRNDENKSARSTGIPTWRFRQTDADMRLPRASSYVSDQPYQLMDDADDRPDVPLGRVPARTSDEVRLLLNKLRQHESADAHTPLSGFDRVTYVAGEGRFGLMDSVLESMFKAMVSQLVPESFDVTMTYAKATSPYCPPPSKLSDTVLSRLGEGCVLFNYVGHGFERGFDALHWRGTAIPILSVGDVARLGAVADEHGVRPLALLTCCSAGWFDLPGGSHSLAEALLFDPSGPVAVIAGSRVTHPYANIVLQMDITRLLLRDRVVTVGVLDLFAARSMVEIDADDRQLDALAAPVAIAGNWKSTLTELRFMHTRLYNLLGDPATTVFIPETEVTDLALTNGTLSGVVQGMQSGTASVTVETPRTSIARLDQLRPVNDPNDAELESKAANNYTIANDRVLARYTVAVSGGRLELPLDDNLCESQGACIRIAASGVDATGQAVHAVGTARCPNALPESTATKDDRFAP